MDVIYLALGVGLWLLMLGTAYGCRMLQGPRT